jgi:vacuolar-type H+-ATPase subunit H
METLKEIRDTEKKAREFIEKAKMESEAMEADTKSRAKSLLSEASEESGRIRKEIQAQTKELAVEDTKALETAYEEKVIDLKKRIEQNQDKAVQLILNSILPEDQ